MKYHNIFQISNINLFWKDLNIKNNAIKIDVERKKEQKTENERKEGKMERRKERGKEGTHVPAICAVITLEGYRFLFYQEGS